MQPTENPSTVPHGAVPHGAVLEVREPVTLQSGETLQRSHIAYTTHGTLNAARTNAILVCHALTGDQYVTGRHPITGKAGWWETMVGPGAPLDTDTHFIICANVLGGCLGSTGPGSPHPETGEVYGLNFPLVTIADMVDMQRRLVDHLGIERLLAVVGGSMGGMQVLQWAARYPERVAAAIPIATSARHSSQNIAFHEVGRQAVMADPDWRSGRYMAEGTRPTKGLAVARMGAHITYMSDDALHRKFGRSLQDKNAISFGFDADFQIESYLRHQGMTFVDRFDANSYLYLTRAMDYFDLAADHDGKVANAFADTRTRFCVISFTSDWLFPTSESRALVHALNATTAKVSFVEVETDRGHDSFLLDEPELFAAVRAFLSSVVTLEGVSP
ncbi:MAG: homoserine O-acetyltransferase [Devosiaceae bacterium]|nr:homoserine O-acetyltransferase [Devosiaceae bacterium MH13]